MSEWSNWNYINVVFVFFSALVAYMCFEEGNDKGGWMNVFASALNFALIGVKFL